jgi:Zn-dependent peptidase ImmA (M78 family)
MSKIHNKSLLEISQEYNNTNWISIDQAYPISLEQICDAVNIYVNLLNVDIDISGKIFKNKDDSYQIDVNAYDMPTRIRFTVAHELGHFVRHKSLLDEKGEILERKNNTSLYSPEQRTKEIEANQFAAELLMPEFYFLQKYELLSKQYSIDDLIDKLADHFWVSKTTINYRMLSLGINYA